MKDFGQAKHLYRLITLGVFVSATTAATAATVGLWRFDESGVNNGDNIVAAASDYNNDVLEATNVQGTPQYSDNVPGPFIREGSGGPVYENKFSLFTGAGAPSQRIMTPYDELLDQDDWTMEFFFSVESEIGGYHSIVKRDDTDSRINFDWDHGTNKARYAQSRVNFREGTSGNGQTVRIDDNTQVFVDTAANDNDTSSYGSGDPAAEGNGIDDHIDLDLDGDGSGSWHHLALTFEGATSEANLYLDGVLHDTLTITNYVHPDRGWQFGLIGGAAGGPTNVYVDAARYSDVVLTPDEFLQVEIPEPSTYVSFLGLMALGLVILSRRERV